MIYQYSQTNWEIINLEQLKSLFALKHILINVLKIYISVVVVVTLWILIA